MVDQSVTGDDINKQPINNKKQARKGCCINIWKMTTHTKIVPQDRLYKYLADRSIEIGDDELQFSTEYNEMK